MFRNVGTIDRIIRVVVGLLLIIGLPKIGWHWTGWIGIVLLITGIFGMSPTYKLLGLSTHSAKPS